MCTVSETVNSAHKYCVHLLLFVRGNQFCYSMYLLFILISYCNLSFIVVGQTVHTIVVVLLLFESLHDNVTFR